VHGAAGRAPAKTHGTAGGASRGRMPLAAVGDRMDLRVMRQVRRHGTLAHGVLGARPADGRFPLVLFSHGLSGSPEWCSAALAAWASAGFVVAAPTFPHTSEFTRDFRRGDIVNQPDDVRYVLDRLRRLSSTPGDPLHGRIAEDRVAAVGHSAGGYTTTGLFVAGHDPRLRAGVVMAGWHAPDAFAGPSATMLFLQGTADPVVPAAVSRAAFDRVPWPKSYLLMRRLSHADYLRPDQPGYARATATVAAFLRWTLAGDQTARLRLPPVLPPIMDAVG
jgi:dienelactone hydrolase